MPDHGTLTYEEVLREIKACVDQISLLHELEDGIKSAQNGEDVSSRLSRLKNYVRPQVDENSLDRA